MKRERMNDLEYVQLGLNSKHDCFETRVSKIFEQFGHGMPVPIEPGDTDVVRLMKLRALLPEIAATHPEYANLVQHLDSITSEMVQQLGFNPCVRWD
jgi:hypothetical protein